MDFAAAIYVACFLACLCCALLLIVSWLRLRIHLLLWLGIGFSLLCARNGLLLLNTTVATEADLTIWRVLLALLAACAITYGLARKAI